MGRGGGGGSVWFSLVLGSSVAEPLHFDAVPAPASQRCCLRLNVLVAVPAQCPTIWSDFLNIYFYVKFHTTSLSLK